MQVRGGARHSNLRLPGNNSDLLAHTFDAETVTANQCQGVFSRVQLNRHEIQRLRVVFSKARTLAPLGRLLSSRPVHQQAQPTGRPCLWTRTLWVRRSSVCPSGQVNKTRRVVEGLDQQLKRIGTVPYRTLFSATEFRDAAFVQPLAIRRGVQAEWSSPRPGFAAHGTQQAHADLRWAGSAAVSALD